MILKDFFRGSAHDNYQGIKNSLTEMGFEVSRLERMNAFQLAEIETRLTKRANDILRESKNHEVVKNKTYVASRMTAKAAQYLREVKLREDDEAPLIEGMTYYRDTVRHNGMVSGYRVTYLGEDRRESHNWSRYKESEAKMKIMEVLRYGDDEDFRTLYVEMANGRSGDSTIRFNPAHITESTKDVIKEMAAYCDSRWEGSWPWETTTVPSSLQNIIKENAIMRSSRLQELRESFNHEYVRLFEGEVEQSEVVLKGREIIEDITRMIHNLGKISAEAMTSLKDEARSAFGDALAKELESISGEYVTDAVDSLGALKSAVEEKIKHMEENIGVDPVAHDLDDIDSAFGGDEFGDDIGTDLPDDFEDGDLDGEPGEESDELSDMIDFDDEDTGERDKK